MRRAVVALLLIGVLAGAGACASSDDSATGPTGPTGPTTTVAAVVRDILTSELDPPGAAAR